MIQRDGSKADILIIDDIAENLEILATELTARGYYARPVNSGKLGLTAARAAVPDLILLDILMQEMDGYEVCLRFKADRQLADIPIIFISGLDEAVDKVRAFELGAVDYITKPFQIEEVVARIEIHLTLYRQRHELEQQRELKARFVSMATHEFRTPMSVIKTIVSIMLRSFDKLAPEDRVSKLKTISQEIDMLDQLVSEIISFNKMDMGRLEFRPEETALREFCDKIAQRFRQISESQLLRYEIAEHVATAYVDPRLLDHVLSNLLSNAFKYSPSGSHVDFRVSQDGDVVMFEVADTGIGIPADERKSLFSPFFRASNAGRIAGTGLGLAIAKQYVERHGGTIRYESKENVGTKFTVQIPCRQS